MGSRDEGERKRVSDTMKNHMTVHHGLLADLTAYLIKSGWQIEKPVGKYEVLRARRPDYPRPLLIHDRTSGGCGYSIDERDLKVYQGWKRNRRKRGLDPNWPGELPHCNEEECEPPYGMKCDCELNEYGWCTRRMHK